MSALEDSVKKLNEQLEKIAGIKTGKALMASSETLRAEAQKLAPVKTGALRANSESVEMSEGEVQMQFNQDYAAYVELGTSKWSGKPFVRPAIDQNEDKIVKAAVNEIQRAIKEAANGNH